MPRLHPRALSAALALLAAACGGSSSPPAEHATALPRNVWTWVDVPGTACHDGSPTGMAVNPGDGPDVLLFLNGGGACWDALTCLVLKTASLGPYGRAQFEAQVGQAARSILDRSQPESPFRQATLVFVPYCTGDVHAGDRVAAYTLAGATTTFHHAGHANVLADLAALGRELPAPAKVTLAGASAGGFGTWFNLDAVHAAWPGAEVNLLDDSGPPVEAQDLDPALRDAWRAAWGLDALTDPLCPACRADPSAMVNVLAQKYPLDRLALLSSEQDAVISAYLRKTPADFQAALLRYTADVFDELPGARHFLVPGATHTMVGDPASFTAGGQDLWSWLSAFDAGGSAWISRGP
ncbi:pectinacetylesterase family protein [Anaeromyxobacter paludicola]|uniref:Lipoprotein n=1 Tax=Anaeromyxobacter paludicola TaxID=2918171 RepID=A0ABM7X7W7_9BACT|nr:pectinacetylesterase family protein [Anaeromyxobacter paludicola]BDG07897.1 hypothetical protein AMPC_10100 [Anaeromyxobacter paludicola]